MTDFVPERIHPRLCTGSLLRVPKGSPRRWRKSPTRLPWSTSWGDGWLGLVAALLATSGVLAAEPPSREAHGSSVGSSTPQGGAPGPFRSSRPREVHWLEAFAGTRFAPADPERDVLRQAVASTGWVTRSRSSGRELLVQGNRVTRLAPSGVPDLTFGGGDGEMRIPDREFGHSVIIQASETPDGGLLAVAQDQNGTRFRVFRLDGKGDLIPRSLSESAVIHSSDAVLRIWPLASGALLCLVANAETGDRALKRWNQRGHLDPKPVLGSGDINEDMFGDGDRWLWSDLSVVETPGGVAWLSAIPRVGPGWPGQSGQLFRLKPDGRLDAHFQPLIGSRCFGLDAQGRAYFSLQNHDLFRDLDLKEGLVRFLPDGNVDESYRPSLGTFSEIQFCQVFPDGATLLTLQGGALAALRPDGMEESRILLAPSSAEPGAILAGSMVSAERLPSGNLRVVTQSCSGPPACIRFCGDDWPSCLERSWILSPGGWGHFFEGNLNNHQGEELLEVPLSRSWYPSSWSEVGFPSTGVIMREGAIQIRVARSGPVARSAEVRGRALPWRSSGWDSSDGVPFTTVFLPGEATASIDLNLPREPAWPGPRDYLVRLESGSEVRVSMLNECRLWVVNDSCVPPSGELRMLRLARPNPSDQAWLVVSDQVDQQVVQAATSMAQPAQAWSEWNGAFSVARIGPMRLQAISVADGPAQFFRLRPPMAQPGGGSPSTEAP